MKTEFAPAQFFELTNDQKMSAPAFREFDSGLRANAAALVKFSAAVPRDFGYEDGVKDDAAEEFKFLAKRRSTIDATLAIDTLAGGALGRSDLYKERVNALATWRSGM